MITTRNENPLAATADDASAAGSAQAIADRIASSISLGLLSVGERLPTEVELAQQLGVAVATLRKGLAVLRDRELVVTHRGRSGGTFIVKAPFPTMQEARDRLAATSIVDLRDLRDERVAVGTAAARLASARAWGGSVGRLRRLAEQGAAATTASAAASADSRFHIELAVLSQSARLLNTELKLQSEINSILWAQNDILPLVEAAADYHLAIVDGVEAGDGALAASTMLEHLEADSRQIIEAKLALDIGDLNG